MSRLYLERVQNGLIIETGGNKRVYEDSRIALRFITRWLVDTTEQAEELIRAAQTADDKEEAMSEKKTDEERARMSTLCQVCNRECAKPTYYPALLPDTPIYMCKTCWAIWYDGETDTEEIKRHSLHWPVDSSGAYRKNNYDEPPEPPKGEV